MFFIVKHRNSWCLVPIVSEGGSIERGRLLNWMLAGRSTLIYSKVVTWISQRLVLWHECDSLFWRQRRWWNDRYANGNNAIDNNTNNNDANDNKTNVNDANGNNTNDYDASDNTTNVNDANGNNTNDYDASDNTNNNDTNDNTNMNDANGNNANDHNTNNNDANDNNAKNNNSNGIYAFDNDYDVTNDVFLDWRKSSARPQDGLEALALVVNENIFVELKMGWSL